MAIVCAFSFVVKRVPVATKTEICLTKPYRVMEEHSDKLYCPYCGSSQLTANKKGFGAGKALTGAVLTGGIGLLAGFIGSGKVKITCLKCGRELKPGELRTSPVSDAQIKKKEQQDYENLKVKIILVAIYIVIMFIVLFIIGMCS